MDKIYAIKKNGQTILTTSLGRESVGGTLEGVWNYDEYACTLVNNAFVIIGTEEQYSFEESFRMVIDHTNPETYIQGEVFPIDRECLVYTQLGENERRNRQKEALEAKTPEGFEMTI